MEILITLDAKEPPAGSVRLGPDNGVASRAGTETMVEFAGWLGLLRALYDVLGTGGEPPSSWP